MIKRCNGQYSIAQLQRCGQLSGAFKYELRKLLCEGGMTGEDTELPTIETQSDVLAHIKLVQDYTGQYQEDGLFEYCPPRCHRGFEEFTRIRKVKSPKTLGRNLKILSHKMDIWRNIRETSSIDRYNNY